MLALIEDALRQRGVDYVLLTGETRDRRAPVQRFQSGKVPVFLISLKAGGVGLNLTAADTVIHYDPWWNPAVENQASDRAYRIGQDKPVFVYRLIARGTVEEKIQHLQQEKAALADGLFSEGNGDGWKLDEADIDALFAPCPRRSEGRPDSTRDTAVDVGHRPRPGQVALFQLVDAKAGLAQQGRHVGPGGNRRPAVSTRASGVVARPAPRRPARARARRTAIRRHASAPGASRPAPAAARRWSKG